MSHEMNLNQSLHVEQARSTETPEQRRGITFLAPSFDDPMTVDEALDQAIAEMDDERQALPASVSALLAAEPNNMAATNSQPATMPADFQPTGGIDTLHVSLYGKWTESTWEARRQQFQEAREEAQQANEATALRIDNEPARFLVEPRGAGSGFSHSPWVAKCQGIMFRFCDAPEATSRPNLFIEIGSVALMQLGLGGAWAEVLRLLKVLGVEPLKASPSRVDLCVDLPGVSVNPFFRAIGEKQAICRAKKFSCHGSHLNPETISLGRDIMIRIYDKVAECKNDPLKVAVLKDKRWGGIVQTVATRVEYQLRRDPLRQVGIETMDDLFAKLSCLADWLTSKWFRIVDAAPDRKNNHTHRAETAPLWQQVIAAFQSWVGDVRVALVRPAKVKPDVNRLFRQALGCLEGVLAVLGEIPESACDEIEFIVRKLDLFGVVPENILKKRLEYESRFASPVSKT